jgi:hypothetical protein
MHQQLWGYKVEEKLYLGLREQKRFITTAVDPRMNGLVGRVGGPIMPSVRYVRIVCACVYIYIYIA